MRLTALTVSVPWLGGETKMGCDTAALVLPTRGARLEDDRWQTYARARPPWQSWNSRVVGAKQARATGASRPCLPSLVLLHW
jgi:hypothetical protein